MEKSGLEESGFKNYDVDPTTQNVVYQTGYEISDDDEDDYEDDFPEEIKKIEMSIEKNNLVIFHPEIKQTNYNQIVTFCKIIKDKNNIPIDPLHTTVPFLTKFEKARVLGLRAKQINNGADVFVDVPPNIFDGYTIALKELEEKKIPFIVRRPMPNSTSEYWHLSDLELL
tara:strand:+ start:548 stop:1057 length:510 start_codon:yes stop_codon:yes gene_type:complete